MSNEPPKRDSWYEEYEARKREALSNLEKGKLQSVTAASGFCGEIKDVSRFSKSNSVTKLLDSLKKRDRETKPKKAQPSISAPSTPPPPPKPPMSSVLLARSLSVSPKISHQEQIPKKKKKENNGDSVVNLIEKVKKDAILNREDWKSAYGARKAEALSGKAETNLRIQSASCNDEGNNRSVNVPDSSSSHSKKLEFNDETVRHPYPHISLNAAPFPTLNSTFPTNKWQNDDGQSFGSRQPRNYQGGQRESQNFGGRKLNRNDPIWRSNQAKKKPGWQDGNRHWQSESRINRGGDSLSAGGDPPLLIGRSNEFAQNDLSRGFQQQQMTVNDQNHLSNVASRHDSSGNSSQMERSSSSAKKKQSMTDMLQRVKSDSKMTSSSWHEEYEARKRARLGNG